MFLFVCLFVFCLFCCHRWVTPVPSVGLCLDDISVPSATFSTMRRRDSFTAKTVASAGKHITLSYSRKSAIELVGAVY